MPTSTRKYHLGYCTILTSGHNFIVKSTDWSWLWCRSLVGQSVHINNNELFRKKYRGKVKVTFVAVNLWFIYVPTLHYPVSVIFVWHVASWWQNAIRITLCDLVYVEHPMKQIYRFLLPQIFVLSFLSAFFWNTFFARSDALLYHWGKKE